MLDDMPCWRTRQGGTTRAVAPQPLGISGAPSLLSLKVSALPLLPKKRDWVNPPPSPPLRLCSPHLDPLHVRFEPLHGGWQGL